METKVCKSCKNQYPLTSEYFHSNGCTPKGTKKWKPECKSCGKIQREDRFLEIIRSVFPVLECSKCGYNKSKHALDFHHLDPSEKDFSISQAKSRGIGKQQLVKELQKCIILCANCHRELHQED